MEVKIISPLEKVFYHKKPQIALRKNFTYYRESFSFQFCFCAEKTGKYRLEIVSDIADCVELYQPKFVPSCVNQFVNNYMSAEQDDYRIFVDDDARFYPDRLDPAPAEIAVVKGWQYAVWVRANASAPAGKHFIMLKITDNDGKTRGEKTAEFRVLPQSLEKCDIPVTLWTYYDCIADAHGAPIFGDKYFEILKNYFRFCVDRGVNTAFVPLFSHPQADRNGKTPNVTQLLSIEKTADGYRFDFSLVKKFIRLAKDCGCEYFEFSHLSNQKTAEYAPKIVGEKNGEKITLFGMDTPTCSEDYLGFLKQLLQALRALLIDLRVYENCFFHVADEPLFKSRDRYLRFAGELKSFLPDGKFIDAVPAPDYSEGGYVIPVGSTQYGEIFKNSGVPHWVYYCCEEMYDHLSNRFLNHPLLRTRVIGAQLYLNGARGFLHWSLNYWYDIAKWQMVDTRYVANGNSSLPSGDCFIVYPAENAPATSERMETFADAITDYRALKTLEKRRGKECAIALLEKYGFHGYTQYPLSEEDFNAFESELAALISEK